jgi:hypothetical protein
MTATFFGDLQVMGICDKECPKKTAKHADEHAHECEPANTSAPTPAFLKNLKDWRTISIKSSCEHPSQFGEGGLPQEVSWKLYKRDITPGLTIGKAANSKYSVPCSKWVSQLRNLEALLLT